MSQHQVPYLRYRTFRSRTSLPAKGSDCSPSAMEFRRTQIRWATGIASILLASLGIFLSACIDSGTGPAYKPQVGLTGVVVDTSGNPLDGVTVHCLFSQWSVPPGTAGGMTLNRISGEDTFAFRLYQNFPNPFSQ